MNSKWTKNLNIKTKTIEVLEENISVNLYFLGFDNGFLGHKKLEQKKK